MTNTPAADKSFLAAMNEAWRGWMDAEATPPSVGWRAFFTVLWAAGFALVFTLIGFVASARTLADWLDPRNWVISLTANFVVAGVISVAIQAMFALAFAVVGKAWLASASGRRRTLFFSLVPLAGVVVGWPIGILMINGRLPLLHAFTSGNAVSLVVMTLLMSLLFHVYFSLRHKETRARMRANEAQLRLLQGQMEPHFLFNTLANVISLIDADAPRAKHMLEALTDYLRASLGGLRHDDSTLAAELDLARRYLELMRTRMGERLRFEIDVDDSLRQARLMPLVLQPLIENAVKHGLEPQVDGGTVCVKAARVGGMLQVCIEDDGAGLEQAARRPRRHVAGGTDGNGIALANLRERLRARFGVSAALTLTARDSGTGTRSCLLIPFQPA